MLVGGCFASNKPIRQLHGGEAMAGLSLRSGPALLSQEAAGWVRLAPADAVDFTVEVSSGLSSSLLFGLAVGARTHILLGESWRLVLEGDEQVHWAKAEWDSELKGTYVHWRTHLGALFADGNAGVVSYFGGRFVAATGYRLDPGDEFGPSLDTELGNLVVGGAAIVGVEWVHEGFSFGGALEVGAVQSNGIRAGTLVLAIYFGAPFQVWDPSAH